MLRSFSYVLLITWLLLTISCKTTFVITNLTGENVSISDSVNTVDSQLIDMYLPYKMILEKDMSRVISTTGMEMDKDKPESKLTNFLADLLLEEGKIEAKAERLNFAPQISYFNYGGIRTSLPKGDITVGKIYELMPFENEMVFVQFSGRQVQEFFNAIAAKGGDSVGGAKFLISGEKAKNVQVSGENLSPDKNYWLVTNDYIANGGDGMTVFTQSEKLVNTGKKIRDVIISYLEKKQKEGVQITAQPDGRIKNE